MVVLILVAAALLVPFGVGVRVGWSLALGRARSHMTWLERNSR